MGFLLFAILLKWPPLVIDDVLAQNEGLATTLPVIGDLQVRIGQGR